MLVRLFQLLRGNRTKPAAPAAGPQLWAAQDDDANAADATPLPDDPSANKAWLGIGLDGTLAEESGTGAGGPIGAPVHNTVQRLKDWTDYRGLTVKVLTPRAATEAGAQAVREWLSRHNLPALEVTAKKDLNMVEMWSAHCVQVISNTGQIVATSPLGLDQPAADTDATPSPDSATPAPSTGTAI